MNYKQSDQIDDKNWSNEAMKIESIKSMQSLPEEAVIKFIKSKGKLARTKEGRLKIADKDK
jgi:hypothetical protein